jgi:type IV pilus assembly protein PilB
MGIEPFLIASSVNVILAQRLVRRPCLSCGHQVEIHEETLTELDITSDEAKEFKFMEGTGCVDCNNTGYKGRQGVYEVMAMSTALREMVIERATAGEMKRKAIEEGMLTLRMDALQKLKRGITTVEEVLKETALD